MSQADRPIAEIMRREFVSVKPDDQIDLVDDIMNLGRVRHMPVLDGHRLVGIVSQRDLLSASLSRLLDFDPTERRTFLRSIRVDEVMSREVVTASPHTGVAGAARIMLRHRIGCLPVVDPATGVAVGLVTETDLLRAAFGDGEESAGPGAPVAETLADRSLRR